MKKLITAIAITLTVNVNAQDTTLAILDALSPNNLFEEDYPVGANDVPSIGVLERLLVDSTAKFEFAKVNPNIITIKVTGTAIPFKRKIPFQQWIDEFLKNEPYTSSKMDYHNSAAYRTDDVVQEFLDVYNKDGKWQRGIIISRYQGSIVNIWDSALNTE